MAIEASTILLLHSFSPSPILYTQLSNLPFMTPSNGPTKGRETIFQGMRGELNSQKVKKREFPVGPKVPDWVR